MRHGRSAGHSSEGLLEVTGGSAVVRALGDPGRWVDEAAEVFFMRIRLAGVRAELSQRPS